MQINNFNEIIHTKKIKGSVPWNICYLPFLFLINCEQSNKQEEEGREEMAALDGTDHEKLTALGNKNYKAQAVWFLNAFWADFGEAEAERVWDYAHRMANIDTQKKAEGNALD